MPMFNVLHLSLQSVTTLDHAQGVYIETQCSEKVLIHIIAVLLQDCISSTADVVYWLFPFGKDKARPFQANNYVLEIYGQLCRRWAVNQVMLSR